MARVEILAAQIEEREATSSLPTAPLSAAHAAHATSHSSPPPTSPPPLASPLPPQPLPQQQTEPLLCSEADTVPESDAPEQQQLLQALLVAELGPEQQRLLEALHCLSSRVNTDGELSVCLGSPTCVARLLLLASDAELMSGGDQVRLPTAILTMDLLEHGSTLLSLYYTFLSLHFTITPLIRCGSSRRRC